MEMAYTIDGEEAIVKIDWKGHPDEIRLRKLSIKEIGYSLDEFLETGSGSTKIKIGAMLISMLPKAITKAPWGTENNNATLDARIGFGVIMELREAMFVLNGLEAPAKKEEKPASA